MIDKLNKKVPIIEAEEENSSEKLLEGKDILFNHAKQIKEYNKRFN